jgi:hypothetical protein
MYDFRKKSLTLKLRSLLLAFVIVAIPDIVLRVDKSKESAVVLPAEYQ